MPPVARKDNRFSLALKLVLSTIHNSKVSTEKLHTVYTLQTVFSYDISNIYHTFQLVFLMKTHALSLRFLLRVAEASDIVRRNPVLLRLNRTILAKMVCRYAPV